LEAGKWEQLPPEPFIRGFIVAYSKYVGLSQAEVMERFREVTGAPAPVEEVPNAPQPEYRPKGSPVVPPPRELTTPFRLPSAPRLITAASFVAVVAIALVLINVGRDNEPAPAAPLVLSETVTPEAPPAAAEEKVVALASETPVAVAAPKAHEVVVQGKARTWLKVVIDEAAPTELFLPEGKTVTYQADKKIKVVLGNSAGAVVTHNGQIDEGKQLMGTIKTYKYPDNARFPQDVPAKPTPLVTQP